MPSRLNTARLWVAVLLGVGLALVVTIDDPAPTETPAGQGTITSAAI